MSDDLVFCRFCQRRHSRVGAHGFSADERAAVAAGFRRVKPTGIRITKGQRAYIENGPRCLRSHRPRVSLWQRFLVWLNNIEAQYQDGEG